MRLIIAIFSVALLFACSNSVGPTANDSSPVSFSKDSYKGMVRVSINKAVTELGVNDTTVNISEQPAMKVKLDYSFSMGRHEETCADFNELMKPFTGLSVECSDDDMPATDVSYYDAVLYANERSKANGLDTAYTYERFVLDDKKHCISMEGLVYRPEVDAFRLPTEAEWVLVASQSWNPAEGWNSDNSDYKLHPVCTKDAQKDFCDMAGNAMEWVNDWLGFFRDTTVTNFAGSPDGGSLGERVVKGGSYRNSPKSINLYSRGDVYTVTSSTRADYVGFRLAFGQIPEATWIGYNGTVVDSRVMALAKGSTLRELMHTYRMKLVFRNHLTENLSYIDYSNGTSIYVADIPGTKDAFHPEISPNGRYVAYCTGIEGVSGKSEVYLRDLDIEGSGLIKLNVDDAAIPRWKILENGDTALIYVSDAGNNKDSSLFKKMSTWRVIFKNGHFRTPRKLFDGAYHDGISADGRLAVSGSRLLRARVVNPDDGNAKDVVWYNWEQACNVSLSTDGKKLTLFLDFGSETGRKFVGQKYGTHERILVVDSTGTLVRSIAAPKGYTFDHVEWVKGSSDFAVATLANAQGAHSKIVLVNFTDNSFIDLAEGDELWHPSFWKLSSVDYSKYNLDRDSAGVYMNADDDLSAILMRFNMELIWRYHDTANVVVVGSSRSLNGVSPKYLSYRYFAVNLSQTPNSLYVSRDILDLYVYRHFKRLKYIVLSLDIDFWYKFDGPDSDNFFATRVDNYAGYVYDKNHGYWEDGYPDGLLEYTENYLSVSDEGVFVDDRGRLVGIVCKSWGQEAEIEMDSTYYDTNAYLLDYSMETLEGIIRKAQEKGVYVVGVIFPQNPLYRKTGAFGRYGLRRSTAKTLIDKIKALEGTYDNFRLMDENKMGRHDYKDKHASDNDHLCNIGAPYFTHKLDSLLKTLD